MYSKLDENDPKIIQPIDLNIDLMEHQKTLIYSMNKLENDGKITINNILDNSNNIIYNKHNLNTNLGILSDISGSGKSLSIVGLLTHSLIPKKRDINILGSKYVCLKQSIDNDKLLNINLIIVPYQLISQWKRFISYSNKLKLFTVDSKKTLNECINYILSDNVNVILISSTKIDDFFYKYDSFYWGRIIIDEADTISINKNININCLFLWLITALPNNIRYSLKPYLINIFKNCSPMVFNYLIVKNNNKYINKSIVIPKPNKIIVKCRSLLNLNIIKQLVPNTIISLINSGNVELAIKKINCNIDTSANIFEIITKKISIALEETNEKLIIELKSNNKQQIKLLKTKINRLNMRYLSVKNNIFNIDKNSCPICMDKITLPSVVSCCNNIFCFKCIMLSLKNKNSCPFCRSSIMRKNINIIDNKIKKSMMETNITKNKLETLKDILTKNKNGKYIIFSNYIKTFDKIIELLIKINFTYKILKGKQKDINLSIENFKNGKINVIMLNLKHFGSGFNLQDTTDIIIYHRFKRESEEQLISRAQRIGRKKKLNIYYLLYENESEYLDYNNEITNINYDDWLNNNL